MASSSETTVFYPIQKQKLRSFCHWWCLSTNTMLNAVDLGYSFLYLTLFSVSFFVSSCSCSSLAFPNVSVTNEAAFSPATATWYGDPTGAGSVGGACGYGADVEKFPFSAMVSAGNANLYKEGKGCGACYEVKCTENTACSGNPVTVTITDECPGSCNSFVDAMHFDLSGTAFGAIAKPGQADLLRSAGILPIQYKRVSCNYHNTTVVFTIDAGANPSYFAFVIEYVKGDADLSSVELQVFGDLSNEWLLMQRSWGANWRVDMPTGAKGPFSIRLTLESDKTIVANNVIPADWSPGKSYPSLVNFD